jgi:CHASE2 domain-containing sensor protein
MSGIRKPLAEALELVAAAKPKAVAVDLILSTRSANPGVDAALAAALQADPLAEIVTSDDVRGMWERMTTARRRAVLGALVHRVEIGQVGKGRRILSAEAAEGTVSMVWRRAEHRVSLSRARSLVSLTPRVPDDAREVIAAALVA